MKKLLLLLSLTLLTFLTILNGVETYRITGFKVKCGKPKSYGDPFIIKNPLEFQKTIQNDISCKITLIGKKLTNPNQPVMGAKVFILPKTESKTWVQSGPQKSDKTEITKSPADFGVTDPYQFKYNVTKPALGLGFVYYGNDTKLQKFLETIKKQAATTTLDTMTKKFNAIHLK